MKTVTARALKVSVIVASLMVFAQLSAQAAPQIVDDIDNAGLNATGFFPGGWDGNDLRSDVDNVAQAEKDAAAKPESETSLDATGFFPGGWDRND